MYDPQGSSLDDSTLAAVQTKIPAGAKVLVLLDSAHEPHHVMVSIFCDWLLWGWVLMAILLPVVALKISQCISATCCG
jgi:cephalosporin hydroxylase